MENLSNVTGTYTNETVAKHHGEEMSVFFDFVVPGVLLNVIGLLGLLGNILSIIILSRPQMKSSIHCLLLGLASYDSVLILTSILMFGLPAVYSYNQQQLFALYFFNIFPYITPVVYPVGMIAQTGSVYLTLCVSVERYVAVCLPLKARAICTFGRARCYVLSLGIFAFLYNIPRFWEVTWNKVYYPELRDNITNVIPTPLRNDPTYISVYITWLYLVVMYIVPFTCLAAFNLLIYHQVRRANSERARLTRLQKKEIGLATMLMVVVFVFFVCNVLALVVNILEVMNISINELNNISNLLVTLNSSVNFIIYCIFGEKFKKIFFRIFCPFLLKGRDQQDFVQRYPEGGALGGTADKGGHVGPRHRNSASIITTGSKVRSASLMVDTVTTRDVSLVRGRSSSPTVLGGTDSRVELTQFCQRRRKHHNEDDEFDDQDDEESGREEEGPLIRASLVSSSNIPVFLSSRQHHSQVPNGTQAKSYGSKVNERLAVRPIIHQEQEGRSQHSLYIPKHDISITVNINTCSNDGKPPLSTRRSNNNLIETDPQKHQQHETGDVDVTEVTKCCKGEKTEEESKTKSGRLSTMFSLSGIREEESDEISKDGESGKHGSELEACVVTLANGFVDKRDAAKVPTTFRHFVSPSNFTDEEKEKLFLSETSKSLHNIEINQTKLK